MFGETEIARLYATVGADTGDFSKKMDGVHSDLTKSQSAMSKFGDFVGGAFKAAVVGVGASIAGLTAGITSSVLAAADMQQGIADIGAVMGLTATETGQLKDLIMDLGLDPNLKVTATEATQAIEALGTAGLTLDQIMAGAAESTVLLANSTGADFAQAANIATDVMSQFNIQATDMSKAVDQITGVTVASKFTIDDYGLALAQAGGVAGSVGVTFEDFNAAIAAISPNFASGSDAGTSFKQLLITLQPKSTDAAEAMKALGLITADGANQFFTATGEMKSMSEIAGILQGAFGGLSEQQRVEAASTIFGTDAMRAAFGLIAAGTPGIENMKNIIGDTSAEESAATRMDTLRGSWEIFTGVVDTLKIGIGDRFLPVARRLIDWTTDMAQKYGPRVIEWAGKFADTAGTVVDWLIKTTESGQLFNDKFAAMPKPIQDAIAVVSGFIDKTKIVTDAIATFGAKFGPLGTAIRDFGFGALREIGAWATGSETDFESVGKIVDAAKVVFNGLWDDFATRFPETATVVNEAWIAVSNATKIAWEYVSEKSAGLVSAIQTFGVDSLKEIVLWATGNETNFEATTKIWEEFGLMTGEVGEDILEAMSPIAEFMAETFPKSLAASTYALEQLEQAWRDITGQTKDSLDETEANTSGFMSRLAAVVDTGLAIAMTRIGTFAANLGLAFKAIRLASEGDWGGMWASIQQIQVNSDAQQLREAQLLGSALKSVMETAGDNTVEGFNKGIDKALPRTRTKMDEFAREVGGPQGRFHTMLEFGSPSKLFERFGTWTMEGFASGISAASQAPLQVLETIAGQVQTKMTEMTDKVKNSAQTIRDQMNNMPALPTGYWSTTPTTPTPAPVVPVVPAPTTPTIPYQPGPTTGSGGFGNKDLSRGLNALASFVDVTDTISEIQTFAAYAKSVLTGAGQPQLQGSSAEALAIKSLTSAGVRNSSVDNVLAAVQTLVRVITERGLGSDIQINMAPDASLQQQTELEELVNYLNALYT